MSTTKSVKVVRGSCPGVRTEGPRNPGVWDRGRHANRPRPGDGAEAASTTLTSCLPTLSRFATYIRSITGRCPATRFINSTFFSISSSESTSKPHFMDDLLAAAGAENVEYPLKTACCGGAHTLSGQRHVDQTRAQPAHHRGSLRRRRDRDRMPDLPLRAGNASDACRKGVRP